MTLGPFLGQGDTTTSERGSHFDWPAAASGGTVVFVQMPAVFEIELPAHTAPADDCGQLVPTYSASLIRITVFGGVGHLCLLGYG